MPTSIGFYKERLAYILDQSVTVEVAKVILQHRRGDFSWFYVGKPQAVVVIGWVVSLPWEETKWW